MGWNLIKGIRNFHGNLASFMFPIRPPSIFIHHQRLREIKAESDEIFHFSLPWSLSLRGGPWWRSWRYKSMNKHHKIWPFVPRHFTWMSRKKPIRKLDEQTLGGKKFLRRSRRRRRRKISFHALSSDVIETVLCSLRLHVGGDRRLNGWFADFRMPSLPKMLP